MMAPTRYEIDSYVVRGLHSEATLQQAQGLWQYTAWKMSLYKGIPQKT